jgi:hypothetical protein
MKIKNICLAALSFLVFAGSISPCEAYPKGLKTLNLSSSSGSSYEDALSRLARIQPDGYAIESIQYIRMRGNYVVIVKLRKVE